MAKEEFDFQALQELKFNEYKKQYCKAAVIKKAKGGLVLVKYDLKARKKGCVFIPFNKPEQAKAAFKNLKDNKIHLLKRTALVSVSHGKTETGGPEVTLNIIKGGLIADDVMLEAEGLFTETIQMALKVTGVSEDSGENEAENEAETSSEASTDTQDTNESTLKELKEAFQEAKTLYKQVGKVEPNLKAKTMLATWTKLEDLMPQLETFISSSNQKEQVGIATKISEAAKTIQATLKPHIDKIRAKQGEKSNSNLDSLTGGISNKAAQLLKDYQDEIASIEGLADKLKSISQIA